MDRSRHYPLQLMDVRLYEAHLLRPEDAEEPEAPGEAIPITVEVDVRKRPPDRASVLLTIKVSGDDDSFDITLVLEGLFEANCDLEDLDSDFWHEFSNVSAMTLLWPYGRECLSTITRRMRLDLPMLPTLNRLAMTSPPTEQD